MGQLNPDKIYVNIGEVISEFDYEDFIYFIYNLGMDYYDGLNIISKEEWTDIFNALKENYAEFEVEKNIKYEEFRDKMAVFINDKFYRHRCAYEVAMDALTSFGKGNQSAKLNYLIVDFEEHEAFDNEKAEEQ